MSAGIRILWLTMLLPTSGALLLAQHGHGGGSHSGGFGRSAMSPSHLGSASGIGGSSISGSTSVYGNHFTGGYPGVSQRLSTYPISPYGPWRRGSRYGRFNYGLPYAYFGYPYFPFFGGPYSDDFDSYNSPGYVGDQGGAPSDDGGLGEQVQQLSAQINGLQDQLAQRTQSSALPEYSTAAAAPAPPSPPITVVLTSGQTLEIQNYAVMGDTFWDFSSQPARKIPLSKIDVAASSRASEANGAEFPQLGSGR